MTPSTLKGWLRSRMICPVGSSSGPNSVSETTVPSTATFCAPVTSAEVKKLPYFVGQLRMSGRSTSVPCTLVDQFWLPAMTCERLLAPAAAYCTPGIALIMIASAGVIVVALPWPMRTPPLAKLPALTMIMLVPADLTRSSIAVRAPVPSATMVITAPTPMIIPSIVRMVRILLRLSALSAIRRVMNSDMRSSVACYGLFWLGRHRRRRHMRHVVVGRRQVLQLFGGHPPLLDLL